jgi:hypothetical protein
VADGDNDRKGLAATTETLEVEESVETLPIGGGAVLVQRQENYTVTLQGVTPEMADLHRDITRMQCETQEKIAKTNAQALVDIAEKEHVAPIKAALKPVWLMIIALTAGGFVSLYLNQPAVAGICFTGLAVSTIVKIALKRPEKK